MYFFDGIIIVEGKNDVSYLSSFITSEYVVLNGLEIDKNNLEYLTHVQDKRKILLLVDPDKAGEEITRKFLTKNIKVEVVKVDYEKCNKNGKHGIAECEKEEILNKLNSFLSKNKFVIGKITLTMLEELGILSSKEKFGFIIDKLGYGKCNIKTFLKRLNYNNVTYDTILNEMKNYHGN